MKFEIKTDLTEKDFTAYYELHQKVHARYAYYFNKYGGIAAVILAIILTVLMIAFRMWENKGVLVPYCIFIALMVLLPFVNRWMISRMYKANRAMLRGEYRFDEKGVWTGAENMSGVYTWNAFQELYHSGRAYYLYIDRAHAIVLPERSFTLGEPAAFGPFVAEKTGLEMKEIK